MGRLPPQALGRMRECCRCGFWYPERDNRIRKIDGKWYCLQDIDSLTEKDRAESIKTR